VTTRHADARAALRPSESEYQASILELLGVLGWRAVHHRPLRSQRGYRTGIQGPGCAGFPDVFAVQTRSELGGRRRVLAAELKGERGRLTADQRSWLSLLAAAGIEAYEWRVGRDSLDSIAKVLR
jgi:hypothetical protein